MAYASGNGSTKEIAEFIAARLIRNGLLVQAHSVVDAPDPAAFEAVVIGSAIHNRAWLPSTEEYVRRFPGLRWQHRTAQRRSHTHAEHPHCGVEVGAPETIRSWDATTLPGRPRYAGHVPFGVRLVRNAPTSSGVAQGCRLAW